MPLSLARFINTQWLKHRQHHQHQIKIQKTHQVGTTTYGSGMTIPKTLLDRAPYRLLNQEIKIVRMLIPGKRLRKKKKKTNNLKPKLPEL